MEDAAVNNLKETINKQQERIKELEEIADLAYDIHTRDPINIREKWGVWRVPAEKLLCEMIESLKG